MLDDIRKDAETRMKKSVQAMEGELGKIRTGRAHPGLIEHVMVPYYGSDTPLNQVANVSVADARTLQLTPFDRSMVGAIEKAIMDSDLGLNPNSAGEIIRIPLPALTAERRKDLVRVVRQEAENGRVAIRNIRRDAIGDLKDLLKEKELTEDETRKGEEQMQQLTDKYVAEVDKALAAKETDLMEI